MRKLCIKGLLLLIILSGFIFSSASAAVIQQSSDWAIDGIKKANACGLIPYRHYLRDYTEVITRGEVAEIIVHSYEAITGEEIKYEGSHFDYGPSIDTSILDKVIHLGIMSGKDDGNFAEYDNLTREEIARILLSFKSVLDGVPTELSDNPQADFVDFDSVSSWAKPYVAKASADGLISGYTDGRFGGKDLVSWEMAVILVERCVNAVQKEIPVIKSITWDSVVSSKEDLVVETATGEDITVYLLEKAEYSSSVREVYAKSEDGKVVLSGGSLHSDSIYYIFVESNGVFSEPIKFYTDSYKLRIDADIDYTAMKAKIGWIRIPGVQKYKITVVEDRDSYMNDIILPRDPVIYEMQWEDYLEFDVTYNRHYSVSIEADGYTAGDDLYTNGIYSELHSEISLNYPQTKEEAQALQTTVTVPVWKINKKGQKYSSTAHITVHHLIADKVKAVFEDIYNGPEQFPIKDVGGFSWRGKRSEHNGGTAIDINSNENYCVYSNGTVVGSHWKPYEDPYSITPYGDVVNAFEKHGFTWGGDAWASPQDYMHFSYLGT